MLPFTVQDNFEEGMNEALLPGSGMSLLPASDVEPQSFEEVMAELEELIGLSSVKTRVKEYAEYLQFIKIRMEKGFEGQRQAQPPSCIYG